MPDYRRAYTPGGAVFLTLVTVNRRPFFAESENGQRLRVKDRYRNQGQVTIRHDESTTIA